MLETCTETCFSPLLIGKIGGAVFFAILFLQSAFDKLNDWNGNLGWIKGYFEKSPLRNFTFIMLTILTVFELTAGLFSLAGIPIYFFKGNPGYLLIGLALCGLSFVSLFMGMRMAKDYTSAASLASYFAAWTGWAILLSL